MPSGELRHGKMYLKRTKNRRSRYIIYAKYEGDSGFFVEFFRLFLNQFLAYLSERGLAANQLKCNKIY